MLSDEELLNIYHGDDKHGHIWMGGAHGAGLRAVEAAVRADQIEKDAAIADAFDWQSWSEPNRVIAAAIRAQLTEGSIDE